MILQVKKYGDPILRTKGKLVKEFGFELKELVGNMLETMYEAHGIGLAAQQVGLALQLSVIDLQLPPDTRETELTAVYDSKETPIELLFPLVLINPSIVEASCEKAFHEEGCLSFPGTWGDVVRAKWLTIKYKDLQGHEHTLGAGGLLARCIQHEMDHLNAVLFIDRLQKSELQELKPQLTKLQLNTKKQLTK
ncbi:MAG: peptide deformylase [Verrucomicrobia bacterium GWC2_42_7]|nr:MAG: peptide deformylase [Verrucomicrobia bacterium GWC2_42_7]